MSSYCVKSGANTKSENLRILKTSNGNKCFHQNGQCIIVKH